MHETRPSLGSISLFCSPIIADANKWQEEKRVPKRQPLHISPYFSTFVLTETCDCCFPWFCSVWSLPHNQFIVHVTHRRLQRSLLLTYHTI